MPLAFEVYHERRCFCTCLSEGCLLYPRLPMNLLRALLLVISVSSLGACAVFAVADAAVTVAATGVKVVAKTVGAVVDVVTPEPKK